MKIKPCDPDNAYASKITTWLAGEFPGTTTDKGQLVDLLTAAFVASAQTRQGPAPTPESLVALRQVFAFWTMHDEPIAVLVPWGSRKPDNSGPDLAELAALRTLIALSDRVRSVYAPGVHIDLAIEDLGGRYLWRDDPAALDGNDLYSDRLVRLVNILGQPWIEPVRESTLGVSMQQFTDHADAMTDPLWTHLSARAAQYGATAADTLQKAQALGWTGTIPDEMIGWYMRSYAKYYPTQTAEQHTAMLARYLAQSWARYRLNIKTKYPAAWGSHYVQVNFTSTIPGIPAALADRRLFYRTLPTKYTRNHLPAWRSRGYVEITDDAVTPKLCTTHEPPADLEPFTVALSDGRDEITINVPYITK